MLHEHFGYGLHRIHVYTENHKLHKEKKKTEEMHHNLHFSPRNVLFPSEHYVNFTSSVYNSLLLLESQQCLIKKCYRNGALKTQQESERVKSAIIYDDGVVVLLMQEQWLQTINFHMQYILFTSHNVSL